MPTCHQYLAWSAQATDLDCIHATLRNLQWAVISLADEIERARRWDAIRAAYAGQ
jgi:hypothetical protein